MCSNLFHLKQLIQVYCHEQSHEHVSSLQALLWELHMKEIVKNLICIKLSNRLAIGIQTHTCTLMAVNTFLHNKRSIIGIVESLLKTEWYTMINKNRYSFVKVS